MEGWHLTLMEWEVLGLSLKVSFLAVAVSLPAGIGAAWVLSRYRFPGKGLVDGLIHLPLVLPPVVTGYLLLVLLGRKGIIGGFLYNTFGITLAFTWKGAAVAAAVMAFPLLVRAVRLSADAVDPGLEDAARTLGAGRMRVFFTITLPLMVPGIITGTILAFARSLGEFGATITFVSNIRGETQTLPLALYSLTQVPDGEAGALRLCIISVALAMTALLLSEWMARRFDTLMKG
ncbi:molybdate ABC transporter permease subunit [Desulfotignum balticum]|jgi:molybdate transport system permease protein|uniref:molybdate ABC transporter permease subunit n=1 Tax=Desulfotignum balticum TaxID=115781 RepID=UPI0004290EC8|nr:molybdate ABC transporter permease subunit [Desulfotignum balticum]